MAEKQKETGAKTLVFSAGAKGGVGKSTMAILLIEALREAGLRVSALEGDEHSPTLVRKYAGSEISVGEVDLAGLVDRTGSVAFAGAVRRLEGEWVVVNTPASGARLFDENPEILAAFGGYELRAVWSLSVNADRSDGEMENDGILSSLDRGLLSALDPGRVTVVKQPFQLAYRGQKCWYDSLDGWFTSNGVKTLTVEKLHPSLVELLHRDKRSLPEIVTDLNQSDPLVGASLQLFWHNAKTEMIDSILSGVKVNLSDGLKSTKGRFFGRKEAVTVDAPVEDETGEVQS